MPLTATTTVARADPYWGYYDIALFFIPVALLRVSLKIAVRAHVLHLPSLVTPPLSLQIIVSSFLMAALYLILKLRYRKPVLSALAWNWPSTRYLAVALLAGPLPALAVSVVARVLHQIAPPIPLPNLLFLGITLGPILEESFFRGCLLPVVSRTMGALAAVIATAILFALFHQPSTIAHWLWFTTTGVTFGWLRARSESTTAAAFMHASCNFTLYLCQALFGS